MDMYNLPKRTGVRSKTKRVGRGNGSGKGNYSTRGLKGQKARSGSSSPAWFEGNQTPLFMRLPKRKGFKRFFKHTKRYTPVSLTHVCSHASVSKGDEITKQWLVDHGFLRSTSALCKVVGPADHVIALTFVGIDAFTASARTAIENVGGSIENVGGSIKSVE